MKKPMTGEVVGPTWDPAVPAIREASQGITSPLPKPKLKPGPPKLRTPEREARILQSLRNGNTLKVAARAAGVSDQTVHGWIQKDLRFAEAYYEALADAAERNIAVIQRAATTSWQAAAWWCERTYPEDYALRSKVDHSGKVLHQVEGSITHQKGVDLFALAKTAGPDAERALEDLVARLAATTRGALPAGQPRPSSGLEPRPGRD